MSPAVAPLTALRSGTLLWPFHITLLFFKHGVTSLPVQDVQALYSFNFLKNLDSHTPQEGTVAFLKMFLFM